MAWLLRELGIDPDGVETNPLMWIWALIGSLWLCLGVAYVVVILPVCGYWYLMFKTWWLLRVVLHYTLKPMLILYCNPYCLYKGLQILLARHECKKKKALSYEEMLGDAFAEFISTECNIPCFFQQHWWFAGKYRTFTFKLNDPKDMNRLFRVARPLNSAFGINFDVKVKASAVGKYDFQLIVDDTAMRCIAFFRKDLRFCPQDDIFAKHGIRGLGKTWQVSHCNTRGFF